MEEGRAQAGQGKGVMIQGKGVITQGKGLDAAQTNGVTLNLTVPRTVC